MGFEALGFRVWGFELDCFSRLLLFLFTTFETGVSKPLPSLRKYWALGTSEQAIINKQVRPLRRVWYLLVASSR